MCHQERLVNISFIKCLDKSEFNLVWCSQLQISMLSWAVFSLLKCVCTHEIIYLNYLKAKSSCFLSQLGKNTSCLVIRNGSCHRNKVNMLLNVNQKTDQWCHGQYILMAGFTFTTQTPPYHGKGKSQLSDARKKHLYTCIHTDKHKFTLKHPHSLAC